MIAVAMLSTLVLSFSIVQFVQYHYSYICTSRGALVINRMLLNTPYYHTPSQRGFSLIGNVMSNGIHLYSISFLIISIADLDHILTHSRKNKNPLIL